MCQPSEEPTRSGDFVLSGSCGAKSMPDVKHSALLLFPPTRIPSSFTTEENIALFLPKLTLSARGNSIPPPQHQNYLGNQIVVAVVEVVEVVEDVGLRSRWASQGL